MKTDYDKRVNDEADEHAQMMNEWREGWDGKDDSRALTTFEYLTMMTSEANNEINDQ